MKITLSGRSLMYSRKIVRLKTEYRGAPALTGYSCEVFNSQITQNHLFLSKDEKRPNPEGNPSSQTLSKALNISIATAQVAGDLLKALAIPLDITVRGYTVD